MLLFDFIFRCAWALVPRYNLYFLLWVVINSVNSTALEKLLYMCPSGAVFNSKTQNNHSVHQPDKCTVIYSHDEVLHRKNERARAAHSNGDKLQNHVGHKERATG